MVSFPRSGAACRLRRSWWLLLIASLLALPPAAAAQQPPLVIPRLSGPIQLDGLSNEPAWEAIAPLPALISSPTFGEQPSERTEFRVAHDDQYLYASGRLYDSDPAGIRATSLRRDDGNLTNDWFVLSLDTFNDKENMLLFGTTPAGIRTDVVFVNDAEGPPNFDWNTFWDAAATRTEEGWFAEIRVPLSSLRFQERDGRVVMGLTVWRLIARKNEFISFPAIPPNWNFSIVKASQAQEVMLEGVRSQRALYATPYLLGGTGHSHVLNGERTEYDQLDQRVGQVGLDLKYGLTSNLTLDVTLNTDFAQVEADDQQVNLTRFSLFFPEKRLFFQERASVFDFPTGDNDRLFYSRRIGLVQGRQVPIYGGARLVGRVGDWDVGVLNMQTTRFEALPSENFGVARLRRQVLNENSYVGGILTTRLGGAQDNVVYGLDGIFRLFGQDYLTLNWGQSFTQGNEDGEGVLDHSLARARWERRGIIGPGYAFDVSRVGPIFLPEMGFVLRSDYTRIGDRISYGWQAGRESPLQRHTLSLKGNLYQRNRDGSTESAVIGPEWVLETKSGHSVTLVASTAYEDLEQEFRLPGDAWIPAGSYSFHSASLGYEASSNALLRTNLKLEGGSFFDGWQGSARVAPTWNASRHLELGGLYQLSHVAFPERDQSVTAHIAQLRTRVMLNTRLSLASFVQYNSVVDGFFVNLRLRYNPREGNDLYLVYNEGLNTDRYGFDPIRPLSDSRTLLLKYSHTFGLTF